MFSAELDTLAQQIRAPAVVVGLLANDTQEVRAYRDATADTRFRIASITKPMVATLALSLAESGRLSLDDVVTDDGATIRHALSHTTGRDVELPGGNDRFGEGDDALHACAAAARELPAHAPAGALWAYSNVGYWLAGASCARAAGMTFEDALERHVLGPLEMNATGFDLNGAPPSHELDGPASPDYPRARRPSGGLVSNAADLLRFGAFHLGDEPAARVMRKPVADSLGSQYGLGFWREGRVVLHTGGAKGFRSILALVPDAQVAVCVLANHAQADRGVRDFAYAALAELAGVERPPQPPTVEVSEDVLYSVAGTYRLDELDFQVHADPPALVVVAPPELPGTRALPLSEREFVFVEGDSAGDRFDFPRPGLARFGGFAVRT